MLPDLSRLSLGPRWPPAPEPEPTGAPDRLLYADFFKIAIERARAARKQADQERRAEEREQKKRRLRFPDLYGTRTYPGILKSTEKEHLEIAALMCYTNGWDTLLNNWLSNDVEKTTPTRVFRDLVGDTIYNEGKWCMYAMFMDDSEFLKYLTGGVVSSPLQFSVDPVQYCRLKSGSNTLETLQMQVVISTDTQEGATREVAPSAQVILDGVKNLLPKLLNPYDTDNDAASLFNTAVRYMMGALLSSFKPISSYAVAPCDLYSLQASGKYVLYRGETIEPNTGESSHDTARVDHDRLVSASRSIDTAAKFVDGEVSTCCLNVFLMDPDCFVLDVNAFMGTAEANKPLICFEDECELIIHPGHSYYKIGSTRQAQEDLHISRLLTSAFYKIPDYQMRTLEAQEATWWIVRPNGILDEDSNEDTDA